MVSGYSKEGEKKMQAEFESVINFVLKQIKLFQADQEFLYAVDTIGFDRINNDEETGLILSLIHISEPTRH